jgi:hypothetical protein
MPTSPVGKRQQQPSLAHPGITGHEHDLGPALPGSVQHRVEPAQLDGPADKAELATSPAMPAQIPLCRL